MKKSNNFPRSVFQQKKLCSMSQIRGIFALQLDWLIESRSQG